MTKKYKKVFAALLVCCMGAGMLPADVSAAGGQSIGSGAYSLIVDNDCAGDVQYEVKIGDDAYEIVVPGYDSYEFTGIAEGTRYEIKWVQGTEEKFDYAEPQNRTVSGNIEASYSDAAGNTYTADEVSSTWTDSAGVQHEAASMFAESARLTFTRQSRSAWFVTYYWYKCDQDGTETSEATDAPGARTNLENAYSGQTVEFYNGDTYTAVVYTPVTEIASQTVSFHASAIPAETAQGTFTVSTFNVDGMPKQIKIVGINYNLNPDGPGSEGSLAISKGMAGRDWDLIATSENFNFMSELMSEMRGYNHTTLRDSIATEFSLIGLSFPFDTDGLSLLYKDYLKVENEQIVSWNTHYSTDVVGIPAGNGADGMIDKGYRSYQVEFAPGVVVDVYILHMDADSDAEDIAAREAQLTQLADAIKASDNGNPIIVMGDTNCRYTREKLETLFIGAINEDERFTVQDAWIEKVRDGVYPVNGSSDIVANDKGGSYPYPQAEIVDKVFYINNTDSDIKLTAQSYTVATDFVDESGNALADHWPVVVEFQYEKEVQECTHNYVPSVTEPTCTMPGYTTYTCSICGDTYTADETAALGHAFGQYQSSETEHWRACTRCGEEERSAHILGSDHICTVCGYEEKEEPETPEDPDYTLGSTTLSIESGKKYAITFSGSSGTYLMIHDGKTIDAQAMNVSEGDAVDSSLVWTLTEVDGKYQISAEIDGETYYVYRTNIVTSTGYKVGLRKEPFSWTLNTEQGDIRFYVRSNTGKNHFLRYYNSKLKWMSSTKTAWLGLHEII